LALDSHIVWIVKGEIPKMVGAVIIAHSFIGKELIATAEYIVGKIEGITAVSIDFKMNAFEARKTISEAIKQIDQGDGILIFTDLFGGSPSNIAFSFLNKEKTEVITGVNLPMILTFWNKRENTSLAELAKLVQLSGTRNIVMAKDLMEEKGAFQKRNLKSGRRVSEK
jgi:PTS system mannose-specific IIA component